MQGYFKQPDSTTGLIQNGWFYSGDLGFIDKQGYLFLTGREKDVIVLSSGKNIYPEELEEVFLSQSPYIKEMCILGATEKKFGKDIESLYAVIVPDIDYFRKKNEINIKEKIRWEIDNISKKLPSYQHIMGFSIAKEELPRTQLKKIKRYQVRQAYLKERVSLEEGREVALSQEDAKILETALAQKVMNYISKELNKRVYLDSHLEIDLGIDSLSRVELGLELEALLKVKIPADFIEKVFTVKELIGNLQRVAPGKETLEFKEGKKTWSQIIKQTPPDEIINKIRLTSGFLDKLLTFIFKNIFCLIFRVFWLLKIEGKEFIPKEAPYIFCPNHASYLDGFVLFGSIPFNSAINIFFLGHAAIFEHPLVAWTIKLARLISIDPATRLTEAMQACFFALSHKKIICIFSEGSRSISEEIGEFKKGIGILAKELNIPIIPVYIRGSHYSWPRGNRFPRPCPLKVIFGRPIHWQDLGDDYDTIANGLRAEVLRLAHENS
jgi:long-chain acyl-CoA synthetase